MKELVNEILETHKDIKTPMLWPGHLKYIMDNLASVLHLPGEVVELGCNVGMTTSFMRRLLDAAYVDKDIHVYESFKGLPEKTEGDGSTHCKAGDSTVLVSDIKATFEKAKLKLPIINAGFFKDIPDDNYPDKICFAFFDGDFYSSIMDSFKKVYDKIVPGGIILIHDYNYVVFPGTKKASEDFLADKPEKVICEIAGIGKMVKQ